MTPQSRALPDGDRSSWLAAAEMRWPGLRRRLGSMGLAIALELVLLLALLTLGSGITGSRKPAESLTSVSFAPQADPDDAPRVPQESERKSPLAPTPAARPVQQPIERAVPDIVPPAMPTPAALLPVARSTPAPVAAPVPGRIAVRMRDEASGPTGAAGPSAAGDSQVVGSGPNGEPVYGARWYREPTNAELRGYLSTVAQPGWATINCKTAPGWRVESCYLLDQFPDPSNMGQAVLAAAWQFQVRPPVKGGKSLVGEWVRIRITYAIARGRASG